MVNIQSTWKYKGCLIGIYKIHKAVVKKKNTNFKKAQTERKSKVLVNGQQRMLVMKTRVCKLN